VLPHWPGQHWGAPGFLAAGAQTGFSYQTGSLLDVDGRAAMFFNACAAPKKLGAATFYLLTAADSGGTPLDGGTAYQLRVPPRVPARQFWAVTVYDLDSAAFIRESPETELNSYQDLQRNADGSVEVCFAPQPPAGNRPTGSTPPPGGDGSQGSASTAPDQPSATRPGRYPTSSKRSDDQRAGELAATFCMPLCTRCSRCVVCAWCTRPEQSAQSSGRGALRVVGQRCLRRDFGRPPPDRESPGRA
jgi:uncharacterized protein DUF1214